MDDKSSLIKNFLFIDDSGSKSWVTPFASEFIKKPPQRSNQNLNFWRGNYFVLAGLHIERSTLKILNPHINDLKMTYFGNKNVEIKSDWLRNPSERRKHYLEPFSITEEKLKEFIEGNWYKIFEDYKDKIQIHSFVLDKRYYKRRSHTPLQITTQVLFDRVELHPNKICSIVFDQMNNEIKSEKHEHGEILKISNKEINLGSFQTKYSHLKPIRFEKSHNSNFLQLADTVAYNIFRQFVDYGDIWEDGEAEELSTYPFFEKLSENFYNKEGRIAGLGLVKIPDMKKIKWGK